MPVQLFAFAVGWFLGYRRGFFRGYERAVRNLLMRDLWRLP